MLRTFFSNLDLQLDQKLMATAIENVFSLFCGPQVTRKTLTRDAVVHFNEIENEPL